MEVVRSAQDDTPGVFPFTRTEAQITELRRFAKLWVTGTERFWGFDDVLAAMSRSGAIGFYAAPAADGAWLGFIFADVGPFTADLLYVYVENAARAQGTGRKLVAALVDALKARAQIEAMFLEVRASNSAAQKLYQGFGMRETGRRKAYYADGEDALVFKLELKA